MAINTGTDVSNHTPVIFPVGQHLYCHNCGSEVEVVVPCQCEPPDMVIQCCGRDMLPTTPPDR